VRVNEAVTRCAAARWTEAWAGVGDADLNPHVSVAQHEPTSHSGRSSIRPCRWRSTVRPAFTSRRGRV